jgi:hypothetical protein
VTRPYADTPEQPEQVLGLVSPHLPTVHLNRGDNVLHRAGRDVLEEFATRFAGRVWPRSAEQPRG